MYKNPFEKGQLIIQFVVNFPKRIPPEVIPALENCLPARPLVSVSNFCLLCSLLYKELRYFYEQNVAEQ